MFGLIKRASTMLTGRGSTDGPAEENDRVRDSCVISEDAVELNRQLCELGMEGEFHSSDIPKSCNGELQMLTTYIRKNLAAEERRRIELEYLQQENEAVKENIVAKRAQKASAEHEVECFRNSEAVRLKERKAALLAQREGRGQVKKLELQAQRQYEKLANEYKREENENNRLVKLYHKK